MATGSAIHTGSSPHSIVTPEGCTIIVKTGDIVNYKAEVLVNITTSALDLSGGTISKNFLSKAGSGIQDECNNNLPNGIKFGQFAETSGGNLACKKIYHGCLHNWDSSSGDKILCQLVDSMLTTADTDGYVSIAFPAIGTGNLGYPRDVVIAALFNTIIKFSKNNSATKLKSVAIVLLDKDTENVQVFTKYVASLLGVYTLPIRLRQNGVELVIRKGNIAKLKADVMVNSTDSSFNLMQGPLSRAIVAGAGDAIRQECADNKPDDFQPGDIVETTGGNLSVEAIYHTSLLAWKSNGENVLKRYLTECLKRADGDDHTSILLPALGTGILNFPGAECARIMYECIKTFTPSADTLKKIYIIVFDEETTKAFASYYGDIKDKHKTANAQKMKALRQSAIRRRFDPFIAQLGLVIPSDQVTMSDIDSGVTPHGMKITIRKGTIVKETTDAVVNVIDKDLNMRDGNITKAILSAAGPGIEQEFKTNAPNGRQCGEFVSTSSGNMPCKQIYHGVVPHWSSGEGEQKLKELIDAVLTQAEADQYTSIAFPAVGTGLKFNYPADKVAKCTVESIHAYSAAHPNSCIKEIKIVLYPTDNNTIKAFEAQLHSQGGMPTVVRPKTRMPDFPSTWVPMAEDDLYKVVDVPQLSSEYTDVAKQFTQSSGSKTIIKIQRIQCPNMYMIYAVRKIQLETQIKDKVRFPPERILYHGTSSDVLDQINLLGFNRSYAGKNGTLYGHGVYFATTAMYSTTYASPDSQGNRYMYQCRVLTGVYTKGSPNMKVPPARDTKNPTILYDTVVDSEANPAIFVVFYDAQSYPEYLITFK